MPKTAGWIDHSKCNALWSEYAGDCYIRYVKDCRRWAVKSVGVELSRQICAGSDHDALRVSLWVLFGEFKLDEVDCRDNRDASEEVRKLNVDDDDDDDDDCEDRSSCGSLLSFDGSL